MCVSILLVLVQLMGWLFYFLFLRWLHTQGQNTRHLSVSGDESYGEDEDDEDARTAGNNDISPRTSQISHLLLYLSLWLLVPGPSSQFLHYMYILCIYNLL